MDRAYFKEKKTGKKSKSRYTKCCNQDKDRDFLNKNNKADWERMEQHCEDHLMYYPLTKDITPICCEVCGKLIKYITTIVDTKKYTYKRNRKED